MAQTSFALVMLAIAGGMALVLGVIGVYGVISYTAAQRTHEMGIRAALGASAGDLRKLIFREGMRLALIGLPLGLIGTLAAARILSSMIYGIGPNDPLTIAVVAALLWAVAALASFVPARRITKGDPIEALRHH